MNYNLQLADTLLWSNSDSNDPDNDKPLLCNFTIRDINKNDLERLEFEFDLFCERASEKFGDDFDELDFEQVAHNFILARNGEGITFMDGEYLEHMAKFLQQLSHQFLPISCGLNDETGEIDLYFI